MRSQLQLEPSRFLILSTGSVQDIEIATTLEGRRFGSVVFIKPNPKLKPLVGRIIRGAIDFNAGHTFLIAED